MALSQAMLSASQQLAADHSQPEYSTDFVDDVLEMAVYTPATYNRTVWINGLHEFYGEFDAPTGTVKVANLGPDSIATNQGLIDWSFTWPEHVNPRLSGIGDISMDIETFDMATESDTAIPYLQQINSMWKEQTTKQIGFYTIIPDAEIIRGVGLHDAVAASSAVLEDKWRARTIPYMQINDRNASQLIDYVDFLVPRCYMMYTDWMTEWKYCTAFQILEAIRIGRGKPVYPIVWFKHHPTSGGTTDLSEADWITTLQFVAGFPGISGVYVWTEGYTTTLYDWKDAVTDLLAGNAGGNFVDAPPP